MSEEPLLLRPDEVALKLGISVSKVYQLISRRELPFIKIGTSVRIVNSALEAWVQQKLEEQGGEGAQLHVVGGGPP
jgi:excisionase family DNA binding protein